VTSTLGAARRPYDAARVERAVREILLAIGEDPDREGLDRTPARVEKALASWARPVTVAVMGCMVNGPGEAREADVGVACGRGTGVIFKGGRVLARVAEKDIVSAVLREVEKLK